MIKNIAAVAAGYLLWTVIFLGGAAVVRAVNPDVHDDQGFTTHALTLMVDLVISIIASLAAGFVCAKIAVNNTTRYVGILAGCLLATGIPVQLGAWDKLPVWYNLTFLILLVPITMIGGFMAAPSQTAEAQGSSS
jgi:hypothetical protein